MKRKICTITMCDHCPYFRSEWYDPADDKEVCVLLKEKIWPNKNSDHEIPDDCPLENA